jgi:hypothetical protein
MTAQIMDGTVIVPVHPDGMRGRACTVRALSHGTSYEGLSGMNRYMADVHMGIPVFSLVSATEDEVASARDWLVLHEWPIGTTATSTGTAWEVGLIWRLVPLSATGMYCIEEVRP